MKKNLILFLFIGIMTLILSACSNEYLQPSNTPSEQPSPAANTEVQGTAVFTPEQPLTMEETIQQFIEQQYKAYVENKYLDLSYFLDMNEQRNRNSLVWLETLIQRRNLIAQNQLAYVETNKYPYTVQYEEETRDQRMDFWSEWGILKQDEKVVHFTIKGEKGKTYPPFMSVNAQHTMRLKEIDGVWKITFHYYPGSTRRFNQNTTLVLPTEEEMLADLQEEFKTISTSNGNKITIPAGALAYDPIRAVEYATTYIESRNPIFYSIPDWEGNCSNFTSQSLWNGFGQADMYQRENMTSQWYAGEGGGCPAWENVEYFWDYVSIPRTPQQKGIHGQIVESLEQLELGGIMQVRTGRIRNTDEQFNHSLILVDKSTLLFAQNSPDCFVYYSDLVNVDTRFYNPQYLVK